MGSQDYDLIPALPQWNSTRSIRKMTLQIARVEVLESLKILIISSLETSWFRYLSTMGIKLN